MSKATLKFTLPEEAIELEHSLKGPLWRSMVQQLDNRLRDCLKYDDKMSVPERTAIELARSLLQRGVEENGLTLWDSQ